MLHALHRLVRRYVLGAMMACTLPLVIVVDRIDFADVHVLRRLNFLESTIILILIFTFIHDVFIVSNLSVIFHRFLRLFLVAHELAENGRDPCLD